MVVAESAGVVKEAPVKSRFPPTAASYHLMVPVEVAVNIAVDPEQVETLVELGGGGFPGIPSDQLTVILPLFSASIEIDDFSPRVDGNAIA